MGGGEVVMYFIPRSYDGLDPSRVGVIDRPHSDAPTRMIKAGYRWCGDNEAFTGKFNIANIKGQRANSFNWLGWLKMMLPYQSTCVFIACPDVIGDAAATLVQFELYAPDIRALGYPVAYVAQDGAEMLPFPDSFDALFVGGSTEWKMGPGARACIRRAQALDKWIHIGRVNSTRRYRYFLLLGADSCDGTHIIYMPTAHAQDIVGWTSQPPLFYHKEEL